MSAVIATGYGRKALKEADRQMTEITCHAAGARHLFPEAKAVLDIGGQDSKAICLGENGEVRDFLMNDKCAAGTGRFLTSMGLLLEYEFEDWSTLPTDMAPHPISSMCAVFAESEVIGLLARGIDKRAIALGLLESIASRAEGMIKRVGGSDPNGPVVFTGGLSKSKNLATLLEKKLARPPHPPQRSVTIRGSNRRGAARVMSDKRSRSATQKNFDKNQHSYHAKIKIRS